MNSKIFNKLQSPNLKAQDKLQTSVNTNATSNHFFMNKPSLMCCSSSVSIEETQTIQKYRKQRKLFMKFLTTKQHNSNNKRVLEQMMEHYKNIQIQQQNQIFKYSIPPLEYMPEIYPIESKIVIEYFSQIWLMQMGYKSQKNKQMIFDRVRLSLGEDQLHFANLFYQKFGAGIIDDELRWQLLMSTCLNGWNHFSTKLIYYCSKITQQSNYVNKKQ